MTKITKEKFPNLRRFLHEEVYECKYPDDSVYTIERMGFESGYSICIYTNGERFHTPVEEIDGWLLGFSENEQFPDLPIERTITFSGGMLNTMEGRVKRYWTPLSV